MLCFLHVLDRTAAFPHFNLKLEDISLDGLQFILNVPDDLSMDPSIEFLRKVLHAHAVIAATRIPTLVSIRLKGHNDWTVLAMPIPNKGHCVKRLVLVLGTFIFY